MPGMPLSEWLKNGRRKGERNGSQVCPTEASYIRFARKAERNKIRESNEKPEKEREEGH